MKKLALILALMLIPCTAFGLEMLDNNAMDSITGQSGVSIVFDDVELFINIDKIGYIDTDGFSSTEFLGTNNTASSTNGGALSITNFQLDTLVINAIVTGSFGGTTWDLKSSSAGTIELQYDYASTASINPTDLGTYYSSARLKGLENYHPWNDMDGRTGYAAKALTIDVTADLPVTSQAMTANVAVGLSGADINVGGVLISLPTAEFYLRDMVLTPVFNDLVSSGTNQYTFNNNASYGTFVIEGMTVALLNGWLEIAPLGHK